jgi:hypothetical protein
MTRHPYRDEELGAALRELDVPEHAPGFFGRFERRAPAPRRPRRWSVAVAVAAAIAAVVAVAIGIPRGGTDVASAAEVQARVQDSLGTLRSLEGVFVYDGPAQGDEERWRFTLRADGAFRLVGPRPDEAITYDPPAGVVRSAQRSASAGGKTIFYAERRGVAPGAPDGGPPTSILPHEFGAYVRALLAARDPRVRETTYDRRPAWRLDADTVPNAIVPEFSGDRLELTVDRETGLPVRVVERKQGTFVRELRIEELALDARLLPDAFRLVFPVGAEVLVSDDGFRRVELGEVSGITGYAPLVPGRVPAGFELAEVAVARRGHPTGVEGGNPPARMVVSLAYRRGFDRFLVTTRLAGGGQWSDPLATGEGFRDEPEQVSLREGALRGASAQLLIVPRGIPHVWALTDELVVTVGGDLGRNELLRVTESLRPQ